MAFIDDNPFERESVRSALPDIIVPELPKDATKVLPYLQSLGLFETVAVSSEDVTRTEMYRREAEREKTRENAGDLDSYLKSLNMRCAIKPFDAFSIPRAAQLTQRTNQFNLRTRRYTEKELSEMAASGESITMCASLTDSFGDYGIISVAILQEMSPDTLFVDTFLMSCRVAGRGVEAFMFNAMAEAARCGGYREIVAEYLPTDKNGPVCGLLKEMGFAEAGGASDGSGASDGTRWRLVTEDFEPLKTFVSVAAAT
jgi:FkbH-like protein